MKQVCLPSNYPRTLGATRLCLKPGIRGLIAGLLLALGSTALVAQPALRVTPIPEGFRVSWPLSASDYMLQGAALLDPQSWRDIPGSPEIVGEEFTMVINHESEERFFRLANLPLPTRLPTLRAASDTAFSAAQLAALLEALGADPRQTQSDERGLIFFLDPQRFQAIPSLEVTDPELIKRLQAEGEDQGEGFLVEAFDMEGLKKHRPMPAKAAIQAALESFKSAGLFPKEARSVPSHSRLALLDLKGEPLMDEVLLDTQVNLEMYHKGIPLTGPGARIAMSFDGAGKATQLLFSFRPLEEGPEVPLLDEKTAMERCASLFPRGARVFKPRLMYYTPSVLESTGQAIIPCYECAASVNQQGMETDLVRRMIPATAADAFLPAIQLTAKLDGRTVTAQAVVTGGLPPYRFHWLSTSADLGDLPEDASEIQYVVGSLNESRGTERLTVVVTDANGVEASAFADLGMAGIPPPSGVVMGPEPIGGVTDFGVERAVSDLGSGIQSGFINRFKKSALLRFNWSGTSPWERDFRQGGTGLDHLYVDNVDLTLYIGHGWPGGFTFESTQDDDAIVPSDVVGAWGNNDLEWLCLVSCQVLKWSSDGKNVVQRWGPAFDRLHMLLGFDTNAYDWSGFGGRFANYALGWDLGFVTLPPLPVRQAWFLAKRDEQPASVVAGAMGPIGPSNVSNCNEYFWGKGPTGPDISKANIQGWWVLYYQ